MPKLQASLLRSKRNLLAKFLTAYETYRITARERRQHKSIPMSALRKSNIIDSPIDVVFVCHNDIQIMPSFLHHYRSLGIKRFIVVDDVSTDGTREFLLEQPDVDIWTSPLRYSQARRGRQWREQLFDVYGKNRWYVNVDSDEFLIFADSETKSISDLGRGLII